MSIRWSSGSELLRTVAADGSTAVCSVVAAGKLGHRGVTYVAALLGCDPEMIRRGTEDLQQFLQDAAEGRVLKKGNK